eukprot:Nk52_evm79s223 gene=Nk52_evmTU79s223
MASEGLALATTTTKVVEVRSVIAETYRVVWGKPLDYSFKELTCFADCLDEEPKDGIRKKIEPIETMGEVLKKGTKLKSEKVDPEFEENEDIPNDPPPQAQAGEADEGVVMANDQGVDKAKKRIIRTTSLRVNNNYIENFDAFESTMNSLFVHPYMLTWIDISFNGLKAIDIDFSKFVKIQVLYMHGNELSKVAEVQKLFEGKSLKKLTLHGNGIENMPWYRYYIISNIPSLKELDFCGVTKKDRALGDVWAHQNAGKRLKKSY